MPAHPRRPIVTRFCLAGVVALLLGLFLTPATLHAQESPPSVSELRRENEQLRLRIDELESQLARSQRSIDELLKQVSDLNARVADLQRELGSGTPRPSGDAPSAPPTSAADPEPSYAPLPQSMPYTAPETMFSMVKESYDAAFGEVETPFGSADARSRYLREADAWTKSTRRSQRGQIDWIIEVRRVLSETSPVEIEYRVVDTETRLPYSDRTFVMEIPARSERRFLQERATTTHWRLRGMAIASPTINRNRQTVGFFDVRPFVGPYIEFGFDLSINSLLPAPEPSVSVEDGSPAEPSGN